MSNQENIVAAIPKGRRNVVRVTLRSRGDQPIVDIRQFEPNGLRVLMPTAKGMGLTPAEARELITDLKTALAQVGEVQS
jgi:hypothetical protein